MRAARLQGYDARWLGRWLLLFFVALAVPAGILVQLAYGELKWQAFHQHRLLAEELATRIDDGLVARVATEQARPFTDYTFLNVVGTPDAGFLQRSDLSEFPVNGAIPGLIGYFQVDARGDLTTPLLPAPPGNPAEYGIDHADRERRELVVEQIRRILGQNRLLQDGVGRADGLAAINAGGGAQVDPASKKPGDGASHASDDLSPGGAPAAFDRLKEVRDTLSEQTAEGVTYGLDLHLDQRFQDESKRESESVADTGSARMPPPTNQARKERNLLPEPTASANDLDAANRVAGQTAIPIRIFESELDPFEVSFLESGHLVLFRKVWRDGQRFVQGLLIEPDPFLRTMVADLFRQSVLHRMSDLRLVYRGRDLASYQGAQADGYSSRSVGLQGQLLLRTNFSPPLDDLELLVVVEHLPPGPGGDVVLWTATSLAVVLCAGVYLLYRLGLRQIELARQQQDFVAAVSHELKTPLTSIRMYGEMLLHGWVDKERRATYYRYIFDESERLSRLIGNVLQLARLTRRQVAADLKPVVAGELMAQLHSVILGQTERAGFALRWQCKAEAENLIVELDMDFFTQILINLVDNAVKFAARADMKAIEVTCLRLGSDRIRFTVRDFGPGVARDQAKKIFGLFYRSEDGLTRETSGTGIGLALVSQQVAAMRGRVDVVNRRPGAEFRVTFRAYQPPGAEPGQGIR